MQKKKLTLKSTSRIPKPALTAELIPPTEVIAGRSSKRSVKQCSRAVIERLCEFVKDQRKAFIQMRHGTGYCGTPVMLEDGWLAMTEVSIHGSKKTATSKDILIQIRDGSFIAHIHPVSGTSTDGEAK